MTILGENRYGKSRVRVMKVVRNGSVHAVSEWNVEVWLEGDFTRCFELGDNTQVLPTDTMKNTVYSLARTSNADAIEDFALELVDHFITNNPRIARAGVTIQATLWKPIELAGKSHPTTFTHGEDRLDTTTVTKSISGQARIASGFDDLWLLKTSGSAFAGFMRDRLTTLKETRDRLLGTLAKGEWTYLEASRRRSPVRFNESRARVMTALLNVFAEHDSLSVQQTLYAMADAALKEVVEIDDVYLALPNKHCNLVDLSAFGQDNPNMIFVPTDEPHGSIEARVRRGE